MTICNAKYMSILPSMKLTNKNANMRMSKFEIWADMGGSTTYDPRGSHSHHAERERQDIELWVCTTCSERDGAYNYGFVQPVARETGHRTMGLYNLQRERRGIQLWVCTTCSERDGHRTMGLYNLQRERWDIELWVCTTCSERDGHRTMGLYNLQRERWA